MTPWTSRIAAHVSQLAGTIGARGSTTEGERRAADYVSDVLASQGIDVQRETFSSATSAWRPYALAAGLVLLAEALFLADGAWLTVVAAALTVLASTSMVMDSTLRPSPLSRILRRGRSQNVWGEVRPGGELRRTVLLSAHLDTHRTPWFFSSAFALFVQRSLLFLGSVGMGGVLWITVVAAAQQAFGVFEADIVPALRLWSLPFAGLFLPLFILLLQADATPYTPGANDNASGAAVVLAIAERASAERLEGTRLVVLLSGCEEVGCYGISDFLRRHRGRLEGSVYLCVDTVGGRGASPCFLEQEVLLLPRRSDPALMALAEAVGAERPELGVHRMGTLRGVYTEGSVGIANGLRTLTILAFRPDGTLPHWHQPSDTVENFDPDTAGRAQELLWGLLKRLDAGQA